MFGGKGEPGLSSAGFQLLLLHLLPYFQRQQPLAEISLGEQFFTNPLNRCHHDKTPLPFQHQLTQYLQALLLEEGVGPAMNRYNTKTR